MPKTFKSNPTDDKNNLRKRIKKIEETPLTATSTTTTEIVKLTNDDIGDGLVINDDDKLNLDLGDGLSSVSGKVAIDYFIGHFEYITGLGLKIVDYQLDVSLFNPSTWGDGLTSNSNKVEVDVGNGLEFDNDEKVQIKTDGSSLQATSSGLKLTTIGEVHYNFHRRTSGAAYDMPNATDQHCVAYITSSRSNKVAPNPILIQADIWSSHDNFNNDHIIASDIKTNASWVNVPFYDANNTFKPLVKQSSLDITFETSHVLTLNYGFGIIDLSQSDLGTKSHYMVEIAVSTEDVIEMNINGQYIGSGPNLDRNDTFSGSTDLSTNTKLKRAVVCVGKYLYFNFMNVGWEPNNSAITDVHLTFTIRSAW